MSHGGRAIGRWRGGYAAWHLAAGRALSWSFRGRARGAAPGAGRGRDDRLFPFERLRRDVLDQRPEEGMPSVGFGHPQVSGEQIGEGAKRPSGHVEREPQVGGCLFVRPELGIESARTREAMDRVPRTSMRAAVTERCCDGLKGGLGAPEAPSLTSAISAAASAATSSVPCALRRNAGRAPLLDRGSPMKKTILAITFLGLLALAAPLATWTPR